MAAEPETSAAEGDEGEAPPESPDRRRANLFIAAFLLYQLAMPLSYYLGGGGYDERFSWRMFSTLRLHRCSVLVQERVGGEGGEVRGVRLGKELQVAWVNMLKRNRPAVVEKFMGQRCEGEGVDEVRFLRKCVDTDGSELPDERLTLSCDSGEVRDATEGPTQGGSS